MRRLQRLGTFGSHLDVRWWEAAGYASLIVTGLAMRLWDLGSRAMHHDESLHALFSWNLSSWLRNQAISVWDLGSRLLRQDEGWDALYPWNLFDWVKSQSEGLGYQHNPMMHGPFQFEANAALFFVFGDSDITARLLYAVMGTILIGMPLLLRNRLGRVGALFVAVLLAASPVLLYFSRFARNDILMAVWTIGLVICMWRYMDEGRRRYLYIAAGLLALAFATKESAYLVVGTLGLWALLMAVHPHVRSMLRSVDVQGLSPPVAIWRVLGSSWSAYQRAVLDLRNLSRPAVFLTFLIALTLPQWSALAAVFQDSALFAWTNLHLAAPEGSPRIGDPVGGANVIAFIIVVGLFGLSALLGYAWSWSVWWRCALIFYTVWTLLYTTFLSNFYGGIKSGIWQSLGYWVVQQGEGRGGQPWYYYFVVSSIYEFLPFFVGAIGIVYFLRKRDSFSAFLAYWPLTTFLLYSLASEKMPWLLVNVTLPFIVLVGKFLADVLRNVDWRMVSRNGGYLLVPGVPLFGILMWNLALYSPADVTFASVALLVAMIMVVLAMGALAVYLALRLGHRNVLSVSLLMVTVTLLVLTVRAGVMASYRNGDTPVEMIVYTQTSPDVVRLLDTFEETGAGTAVPVEIDATSGFSWPWAWYLRNDEKAHFPVYNSESFEVPPTGPVLVVHSNNRASADVSLRDAYMEGERIRHRWWFPEYIYRDLTPVKFANALFDRSAWRRAMDYWLNRSGVKYRLGSEDSYVYFREDVPHDYKGAP